MVAASLTVFEFFLGVLTTLCLNALVHGCALLRLHMRGHVLVSARAQEARKLWCTGLSFALGLSLAAATVLVELHLKNSKGLAPAQTTAWRGSDIALENGADGESGVEEANSGSRDRICMRLDADLPLFMVRMKRISARHTVAEWAVDIALQLSNECQDYGLQTVSTTRGTSYEDQLTNVYGPVCNPPDSTTPLARSLSSSPSTSLETKEEGNSDIGYKEEGGVLLHAEVSDVPLGTLAFHGYNSTQFEVLPFSLEGIPRNGSFTEVAWDRVECSRGKILTEPMVLSKWEVNGVTSFSMDAHRRSTLCARHGNRPVRTLYNISHCYRPAMEPNNPDEITMVNVSCLAAAARSHESREMPLTAIFSDVTALIVPHVSSEPSYACPNATVRYHYVFVPALQIRVQDVDIDTVASSTKSKWVMPEEMLGWSQMYITRLDVISGTCEPTVHVLGQQALLWSAWSEWEGSKFSSLDRLTRFHALTIQLAPVLLSSEMIRWKTLAARGTNAPSNAPASEADASLGSGRGADLSVTDRSCRLRKLETVTIVPLDWAFVWLMVSMSACGVVIVLGIGCVLLFGGRVWKVATWRWSFEIMASRRNPIVKDALVVITEPWSASDSDKQNNIALHSVAADATDSNTGVVRRKVGNRAFHIIENV